MSTAELKGRKGDWHAELLSLMQQFEWDMTYMVTSKGRLPKEWAEIWQTRSTVKKRVTIRVDEDVLRFFRKMGDGYGPRMNAVLRTFMLAQLTGLIEEERLPEEYRERWMGKPRPKLVTQLAEIYGRNGVDPDEGGFSSHVGE